VILSEEIISRYFTYSSILSYDLVHYCFMNLPKSNNGTEKECHGAFFFFWVCEANNQFVAGVRDFSHHGVSTLVLHRMQPSSTQGKGKAVPLQAWSGAEGPRKFRFPD